jgi:hypothetical protein
LKGHGLPLPARLQLLLLLHLSRYEIPMEMGGPTSFNVVAFAGTPGYWFATIVFMSTKASALFDMH